MATKPETALRKKISKLQLCLVTVGYIRRYQRMHESYRHSQQYFGVENNFPVPYFLHPNTKTLLVLPHGCPILPALTMQYCIH